MVVGLWLKDTTEFVYQSFTDSLNCPWSPTVHKHTEYTVQHTAASIQLKSRLRHSLTSVTPLFTGVMDSNTAFKSCRKVRTSLFETLSGVNIMVFVVR